MYRTPHTRVTTRPTSCVIRIFGFINLVGMDYIHQKTNIQSLQQLFHLFCQESFFRCDIGELDGFFVGLFSCRVVAGFGE